MSLRCGCYDQGDDLVFGPTHDCTVYPALSSRKGRPPATYALPPNLTEGVAAADLQSELDRLEHPYESVLHDDVPGDLG